MTGPSDESPGCDRSEGRGGEGEEGWGGGVGGGGGGIRLDRWTHYGCRHGKGWAVCIIKSS